MANEEHKNLNKNSLKLNQLLRSFPPFKRVRQRNFANRSPI